MADGMDLSTSADAPLLTGRIVRFDEVRGYGFVAPDHGDEDVFVHANNFPSMKHPVAPGTRLEFRVVDGGRGPKAYDVRVLDEAPATAPPRTHSAPVDEDGDELCEVLTEEEFLSEVTERLLRLDSSLTAGQILATRAAICGIARSHGWVED